MMPNFEEWAYELSDESESFTRRAEAIEAKLRQAYEAGQAHAALEPRKPEVSITVAPPDRPEPTPQELIDRLRALTVYWTTDDGWLRLVPMPEREATRHPEFGWVRVKDVCGAIYEWEQGNVAVPARAHHQQDEDTKDVMARSGTPEIRDRQPAAVPDAGSE